mmetsp:Transcript_7608/g.25032  ORF Transcript_7608/g.25032 Transcript_7608/m.25032 type:complete len:433 (-) Transcript_7608:141-1439(-)
MRVHRPTSDWSAQLRVGSDGGVLALLHELRPPEGAPPLGLDGLHPLEPRRRRRRPRQQARHKGEPQPALASHVREAAEPRHAQRVLPAAGAALAAGVSVRCRRHHRRGHHGAVGRQRRSQHEPQLGELTARLEPLQPRGRRRAGPRRSGVGGGQLEGGEHLVEREQRGLAEEWRKDGAAPREEAGDARLGGGARQQGRALLVRRRDAEAVRVGVVRRSGAPVAGLGWRERRGVVRVVGVQQREQRKEARHREAGEAARAPVRLCSGAVWPRPVDERLAAVQRRPLTLEALCRSRRARGSQGQRAAFHVQLEQGRRVHVRAERCAARRAQDGRGYALAHRRLAPQPLEASDDGLRVDDSSPRAADLRLPKAALPPPLPARALCVRPCQRAEDCLRRLGPEPLLAVLWVEQQCQPCLRTGPPGVEIEAEVFVLG